MFTHSYTYSVSNGGQSFSISVNRSAGMEVNIDEPVPDNAEDLEIACGIDISELESFVMYATTDMTIKTNDAGSPDDAFELKANQPIVFQRDLYNVGEGSAAVPNACPLTADVTKLFATNLSGGDGMLRVRALVDPTADD